MARLERPLLSGMEPDRTMTVDDFLKLYGSGTGKPVWPLSNDDNSRDSNDSTSALAADCNMLINLSTRLVAQPRPCMQEIDAEKLDGLLGSYPLTPAVTANYLGLSSRPSLSGFASQDGTQPLSPFTAFLSSANTPSFGTAVPQPAHTTSLKHPFGPYPHHAATAAYNPPGMALPPLHSAPGPASTTTASQRSLPGRDVHEQLSSQPQQAEGLPQPACTMHRTMPAPALNRSIAISMQPFRLVKAMGNQQALAALNSSIQELESTGGLAAVAGAGGPQELSGTEDTGPRRAIKKPPTAAASQPAKRNRRK